VCCRWTLAHGACGCAFVPALEGVIATEACHPFAGVDRFSLPTHPSSLLLYSFLQKQSKSQKRREQRQREEQEREARIAAELAELGDTGACVVVDGW